MMGYGMAVMYYRRTGQQYAAVCGVCTNAVWDGCTAYSAVLGSYRAYRYRYTHQYGCTRVVRLLYWYSLYCSCRRCYGAYATALLLPAYICCPSMLCVCVCAY